MSIGTVCIVANTLEANGMGFRYWSCGDHPGSLGGVGSDRLGFNLSGNKGTPWRLLSRDKILINSRLVPANFTPALPVNLTSALPSTSHVSRVLAGDDDQASPRTHIPHRQLPTQR